MATATQLTTDTTTQGAWLSPTQVYGTTGYYLYCPTVGLTTGAWPGTVSISESSSYFIYSSNDSDVRCIQRQSDPSHHDAYAIYGTTLTFLITQSDSTSRNFSVYLLDLDNVRSATIAVKDHGSGSTLFSDTTNFTDYHLGKWLRFSAVGSVDVVITLTGGANVTAFGVMCDPAVSAAASTIFFLDNSLAGGFQTMGL